MTVVAPIIVCKLTEDKSQLTFYCEYCDRNHFHGLPPGHRLAHCISGANSPYEKTGYILSLAKPQ